MSAGKLLGELINELRADPKADVSEKSCKLLELIVNREFEEILALVLYAQGTPVFQLERIDIEGTAAALGKHPGVVVERWPAGYVAPNRPAGSKPIVMQLTLENSREKELRLAGRPKEK